MGLAKFGYKPIKKKLQEYEEPSFKNLCNLNMVISTFFTFECTNLGIFLPKIFHRNYNHFFLVTKWQNFTQKKMLNINVKTYLQHVCEVI